jgi:hypothetical protein
MTESAPSAGLASLQGLPSDLVNMLCVMLGPTMTLVLHRLCKRWYQILRDGDALCWRQFAADVPAESFSMYVPAESMQADFWRTNFVRRFKHAQFNYNKDGRLHFIILPVPGELRRLKSSRKKVLYFLHWAFKYGGGYWENTMVPRPAGIYRGIVYLRTLSGACRRAYRMSDPFHRHAVLKAKRWLNPDEADLSSAASMTLRNFDSNRILADTVSVQDFLPGPWI